MPQAIAGGIITAVGATGAAATLIQVGTFIATQVFISVAARKLAGDPRPARTGPPLLRSVQLNSRDATNPREFVYGEVVKGGQIVFQDTADGDNFTLWTVIALAGHELEEISEVIINDVVVRISADLDGNNDCLLADFTDNDGNKLLRINSYLGTSTQTADTNLNTDFTSKWTTNHRLRGIPYIALRMKSDVSDMSDLPASSKRVWSEGFPQRIRARVKGKKVYDPREGTHDPDDPTTWEYSDNAALCVADYVRDTRMGLGADSSRIDYTILATTATYCDNSITVWDGTGDGVTTTSQKRYTSNGVVSTDQTPASIVETLLGAMVGTASEVAGKLEIYPGRYDAPVFSFGDDDFAGPIRFSKAPPKRDRWNYVRGQFMDAARDWQPSEFAPRSNSTYETNDGARLPRDIRLPLVTNEQRAERLAMIYLNQSRLASTAEFILKANAVGVKRNDTIQVTNTELGWSNKLFRVTEWEIVPADSDGDVVGFHVKVSCRGESSTAYTVTHTTDLDDISQPGTLPTPDNEPVPVNTAEALGVVAGIKIEYFVPWQTGVEAVEVWRSDDNDRANAERRATVSFGLSQFLDEYIDFKSSPPVSMRGGETYYYWLRVRKQDGAASDWFPVSATGGLVGESEKTSEVTQDSQGSVAVLTTSYASYAEVTLSMFSDDSDVDVTASFSALGAPGAPVQTIQYRIIRDSGGANEKSLKSGELSISAEQFREASIAGVDIRTADSETSYDYALEIRTTSSTGPASVLSRNIITQQLR